jgi:hydrogenase maturation protein HypF
MAIVDMIVRCCMIIRQEIGENKVCLSGGVFNNRLILTKSIVALKEQSFEVFWNQKVPLGDGGISLGQGYYGLMYEKE